MKLLLLSLNGIFLIINVSMSNWTLAAVSLVGCLFVLTIRD